MNNKSTVLLTGGTSGIGFQAAINIVDKVEKLILPCRNQSRSYSTQNSFKSLLPINLASKVDFPIVDLADICSIEKWCNKLLKSETHIDTLVLNAGLQYTGSTTARYSAQGFELTLAVNHLANLVLIHKLLPLLSKSTKPRVVVTSSEVHNPKSPGGRVGRPADLGNLEGLQSGKGMIDGQPAFNADKAYKDTKLCNILFARRLSFLNPQFAVPLTVIAWAPGLVIPRSSKGFFRHSRKNNELGQRLFAFLARDVFRITETVENAGLRLSELSMNDSYKSDIFNFYSNTLLSPGKFKFQLGEISQSASDDVLAENLWDISNRLIMSVKY